MTQTEIRERLDEIDRIERQLQEERYRLTILIEEEEGRPDSHAARFARAVLSGDVRALTDLCAEGRAEYRRRFGHWPQQEIEDRAAELLKGSDPVPG